MFRQKTTIIVGAGASCELGLPSGDALKGQILRLLQPSSDRTYGFADKTMAELMNLRVNPSMEDYFNKLRLAHEAAERIRRGLPLALSIDNFLHSHQGDEDVEQLGKLAISISISRAERMSYLFSLITPTMRAAQPYLKSELTIYRDELAKSWYPSFAQLLMSGVQRDNIASAFDNLRFIIFNYDRCLEQYIWMALQSYFSINEFEASRVLENISFIHPYGSLGPLPWRSNDGAIPLGDAALTDLTGMATRIQTFTESVQSEVSGEVKDAVEWAETLIILGFGYLDQNIQLLSPTSRTRSNRVFSTAYGVSAFDQDVMRDSMMVLGGVDLNAAMIEVGSCRDLFDNYKLHLSLR